MGIANWESEESIEYEMFLQDLFNDEWDDYMEGQEL